MAKMTDEERQKTAPATGVVSLHDVIRHLVHYGPARNDAERAELAAAVDRADPDAEDPPEPGLTDAEKAAEYDRQHPAGAPETKKTTGKAT